MYYEKPLDVFISDIYTILEKHRDWHFGTLKQAFPVMKSHNWLASYRTKEGIHKTFRRVSTRGKFTTPIAETHLDFDEHYYEFEKHFHRIYIDLLEFTEQYTF
jgi:acyl carrier protein phosphodiesterase